MTYQSHPLRRNFSLTFDLTRDGAGDDAVLDIIQAVRGIHDTLSRAAGQGGTHRLRLLELELPLLGGRLWEPGEAGRLDDRGWIALVVQRVHEYRERAADLRQTVERCVTDEDHLRLARDIEGVKHQLLDRLGLRRAEMSAMKRELVNSVASVAQVATGVPVVSGLWFGHGSCSSSADAGTTAAVSDQLCHWFSQDRQSGGKILAGVSIFAGELADISGAAADIGEFVVLEFLGDSQNLNVALIASIHGCCPFGSPCRRNAVVMT